MKIRLILFLSIVIIACEERVQRQCGEFDTSVATWRNVNWTESDTLKYLDDNNDIIEFVNIQTEYSEPYIAEGWYDSTEIECISTVSLVYKSDYMGIELEEYYGRRESSYNDFIWMGYAFRDIGESQFYIHLEVPIKFQQLYWSFDTIPAITVNGLEYNNVLKFDIDSIYSNDQGFIPPKYFTQILVKEGVGILQMTGVDGKVLNIVEE